MRRLSLVLAVCVALPPIHVAALAAQRAESFLEIFDPLYALRTPVRSGQVANLVLERDAATLTFDRGRFDLFPPIGGRYVAAAFVGQGRLAFRPPTQPERAQLVRFERAEELDEDFESLVMFFGDSTAEELLSQVEFADGPSRFDLRNRVREALEYIADEDDKVLDPEFARMLLNGDSAGYFFAYVKRRRRDPLMYRFSPYDVEEVSLWTRADVPGPKRPEVISQFHRAEDYASGVDLARQDEPVARVDHYELEVFLPRNAFGRITFAARATMTLVDPPAPGLWTVFSLFPELEVDSARWEGGGAATVFKGKESADLWVRMQADATGNQLSVWYHGDLIDRFGDFFYIQSSISWYPRSFAPLSRATFDITFHSPDTYLLASIGDLVDSTASDGIVTTEWVATEPIRNASFNLGLFKPVEAQEGEGPIVTVLYSEDLQRELARALMGSRSGQRGVVEDVSKSLQFFEHTYGDAPVDRFYATIIPYPHGEAFPGLVHLSWLTFMEAAERGEDEQFRAHEVAHQWWGLGVDYASYHDQWLSEGIADFSGLWYLQVARRDNDKYFGTLRRWRDELVENRDILEGRGYEPPPISMGYRASTLEDPGEYQLIVYRKGAWVMHMLRLLMLDLGSMNEDAFTTMMRQFYREYSGRRATTADFQAVVERQLRMPMGWFFDEWVRGSAIPTYRVSHHSERTPDGKYRVTVRVRQEHVPEDFRMWVPVSVDLGNDRWARLRIEVQGPITEVELPLMPSEPRGIRFNELEAVLCEVKNERW